MLRQALALSSFLQIGQRIKEAASRQARRAVAFAAAGVLALAALVFVLLALYSALIEAGWAPVWAAILMAAGLLVLAVLLVAVLALAERWRARRRTPLMSGSEAATEALTHGQAASEALHDLDRQMARVVSQVGPLSVIAAAFAIGMAAGRRADKP